MEVLTLDRNMVPAPKGNKMKRRGAIATLIAGAILLACHSNGETRVVPGATGIEPLSAPSDLGTRAHFDRMMTSAACAACHPAIYAENQQSAHGRAYIDAETRLATRNFRRDDCIRCHTPRPIFETGIGLTPMQRWTDLEEGNTCMTCHWKQDFDYSRFVGGAECKSAFDPRVGTVQACASCHRIAGTPDQWSRAEHGRKAGNICIDCHMPLVDRPVAVGAPSRPVYSHVFPAAHSESQLRKAYAFEARIEGNEVVVRITNKGVGHNLPTANRQRAFESLVTVRNMSGEVIGSSRLVCRYPYASELAPGQLTLPVGTQIPSGKTREQRVPIPIESGTVECSLFSKLYRPISDFDPTLSRRLEHEIIPFTGLTPSTDEFRDAPMVGFPTPATDLHDFFDPAGFANVARPASGPDPIEIPEGKNPDEIDRLVALLEFHMPQARRLARERLRSIGAPAFPALIRALGFWSNETFNQAIELLASIGESALPAVRAALHSPELYVRCHARMVIAKMDLPHERRELLEELAADLRLPQPLDRRSTAETLGVIGDLSVAENLRPLLDDPDWDVISAAAHSLAQLKARGAVPELERAFARATWFESKRDLAIALAELGSVVGIPALLDGLDDPDETLRASCFEGFFAVTGRHFSYDPALPHSERLEAIARLQTFWAEKGGPAILRRRPRVNRSDSEHALQLVLQLGGGTDTDPGGNDGEIQDELVSMGTDALPALIEGLTFPSGYSQKRELVCETLSRIGGKDAAPALVAALRDPVLSVSEWACLALESTRDQDALMALSHYERRVLALQADPAQAGDTDRLLARVARTSLMLGDERARERLVSLLLSRDRTARDVAIRALEDKFKDRLGYDPDSSDEERAAAAARWMR